MSVIVDCSMSSPAHIVTRKVICTQICNIKEETLHTNRGNVRVTRKDELYTAAKNPNSIINGRRQELRTEKTGTKTDYDAAAAAIS
jgi:hypothetical protein